jgi:hypothetical protein
MYSICSYVAETDEAINLVEGEKVYVIGKLKLFVFTYIILYKIINIINIYYTLYKFIYIYIDIILCF